MSALSELIEGWQEGDVLRMSDVLNWSLVNLVRGDFMEVDLSATDMMPRTEAVAGFLVLERVLTGDGGMAVRVRSVGCSDAGLNKVLSGRFNRKEGFLHLCISTPCTEAEENYLHVTQFRAFSHQAFSPGYYMPSHRRQVAKWLGRQDMEELEEEPGRDVGQDLFGTGGPTVVEIPATSAEGEARGAPMRKEPLKPGGGDSRKGVEDRAKERVPRTPALRQRPSASARVRGKGQADGMKLKERSTSLSGGKKKAPEEHQEGEEEHLGTALEREGMSTEELRRKLDLVRVRLGGARRPEVGAGERRDLLDEREDPDWQREDDSGFVEDLKGLTSGATLKRKRLQEDTKGSSSRDVSTQLIQRAQLRSGERRREGSSRGSQTMSGERPGERDRLLALLNQVEGRKTSLASDGKDPPRKGDRSRSKGSRKKKKGRDKKKKKKKRRLVNGVIVSSEESESSEEESYSSPESSEEHFEAPLRKRSRASPGSVLRLLVQKAEAALDQSALVEIDPKASRSVTDGVKISTYFNLHIRPHFSQQRGAMRDRWLMAQVIDLLRAGEIARSADMLSGHFLAAHQALVDQSWSQAKYLEVAMPEEQSATTPAILLEARKHAKATFKAEAPDAWVPSKGWQRSWFGGGEGGWQPDKGKGKTKKGGKGKEKSGWADREGKGKAKWKETHAQAEDEKK